MIKKQITTVLLGLAGCCLLSNAYADNLVQVFQQALDYDPLYQKAHADFLSITEDVPISRSFLLPQFTTYGFSQYNNQINRSGTNFVFQERDKV